MNEKNEKVKFIGLTIGPIFKTLNLAKKTRQTWTASYLFSFLMKTLIQQLLAKGIGKDQLIVPNADDIDNTAYNYGAGLYPDRLIFQASEGDFDKVKEAVHDTMQIIASGISEKIGSPIEAVRQDLDHYIQVYFLEQELNPSDNPILKLSPSLEVMERHSKYIHHDTHLILPQFLQNKKPDFLSKDAKLERFESLIEIATHELRHIDKSTYAQIQKHLFQDDKDEDETSFIQKLKETFKEEFRTYHKYIAIVQADGDNIGDAINACGTDSNALQNFSRELTAFAREAARLIKQYGGAPVYAGGDDLLFFAPIANRFQNDAGESISQNIFDLIDNLDNHFIQNFPNASLSFGISITYYKYPLNEALAEARSRLHDAKQYENKNEKKNAVAFKILKHSGRSFGTIFYKGNRIYKRFKKVLSRYGDHQTYPEKDKYLNSIVQNLQFYRPIFKELLENVKDPAAKRVQHFFDNSFNESIHDDYRKYINAVAKLISDIYTTSPSSWKDEQKYQAVYAILRTLHFFNQEDDDQR